MSCSCEGYIGYTINLKEDLDSNDFEFFHEFEDKYPQYNNWQRNEEKKDKVILVFDGMNGLYARLIYVEEIIENCWIEGKDYFKLKNHPIPTEVYSELSKAYQYLYGEELNESQINHTLWFHFT